MIDPITHSKDGKPRHQSVVAVLRHFRHGHLPEHLAVVSRRFADLAIELANTLPEGPDLTCALRDLLAAKDNAVRAMVVYP